MNRIFFVWLLLLLPHTSGFAVADTIFESGTLGPTGVNWNDLTDGTVPNTSVNEFVFPGVRFHLDQPAITTQIGGHFVGPSTGAFFGAIIQLENGTDFPDSINLSTPDVLGATELTFPVASAEVFGDLELSLAPGWYALVFGSGLFGSDGVGAAVRNGTDIDDPSYIAFEINDPDWFNLDKFGTEFDNHRFVIDGTFVPEPISMGPALVAAVFLLHSHSFHSRL